MIQRQNKQNIASFSMKALEMVVSENSNRKESGKNVLVIFWTEDWLAPSDCILSMLLTMKVPYSFGSIKDI